MDHMNDSWRGDRMSWLKKHGWWQQVRERLSFWRITLLHVGFPNALPWRLVVGSWDLTNVCALCWQFCDGVAWAGSKRLGRVLLDDNSNSRRLVGKTQQDPFHPHLSIHKQSHPQNPSQTRIHLSKWLFCYPLKSSFNVHYISGTAWPSRKKRYTIFILLDACWLLYHTKSSVQSSCKLW